MPRPRPAKATVLRLLGMDSQEVQLRTDELIEDADGIPAGVASEFTDAVLVASSPEQFGWTQAELDDPDITE